MLPLNFTTALNYRTVSGSDRMLPLNLTYCAELQNRERFYERAVKKKVSPKPPKVLDS
jgi:hypothetical protein